MTEHHGHGPNCQHGHRDSRTAIATTVVLIILAALVVILTAWFKR